MGTLNRIPQKKKQTIKSTLLMLVGNLMFAFALNVIIVPHNLYNGGFTGISQLLKYFATHVLGTSDMMFGLDLLGIIYFILNVPLFLVAYKVVGREFCITSLLSIGVQSFCISVMPVPSHPVISEMLTACVVGGVIAGTGAGLILRSGTSGGGNDIVGVCLAKTHPNVHVGVIATTMNFFILGVCFLLFDIEIVIYSLIYTIFINIFVDRMYIQNINTEVMIFTKKLGISNTIMKELGRGVTNWDGAGAYTNETTYVLVTVVSKYEVPLLVSLAKEIDPNCFIIATEGTYVYGNFNKRLTSKEIREKIVMPPKNQPIDKE